MPHYHVSESVLNRFTSANKGSLYVYSNTEIEGVHCVSFRRSACAANPTYWQRFSKGNHLHKNESCFSG